MLKPLKERLTADPAATLALVRRLFAEYGRRHLRGFAGAVVMMAIAAGCTALAAAAAGRVVNQAYVYRDFRGLVLLSAGLVAIFTIKGLATYGQAVSLAYVGNRITAESQRRIFDKLLTEGVTYFADRHSTDFIARMGYAANAPATVLTLLVTAFARDLLSVAALATVMVWEDPMLSLIALVVAPPAMYLLGKLIKRVRQIAKTQFEGGKRIVETLQETIQGFRVIKAFNLEEAMRERVYQDVRIVEQAANKLARTSNRSSPLMETLGGLIIAATVLYTGYRVLETSAAPGEFTAFTTAFLLAYEPAKRLARLNIDLNTALYGVQVLFQLLDSPATEKADGDKPALALDRGRIEFDDVRFGYREGVSVLHSTSFVAEPGQVTALVGPSGGGKSTIFNLLLRLYDADGGAIRIDGQELAAVTRESVRRKIAYVGQDVFLFRGSFRENIAYGRPGASEAEIVAAAKAAFAHDFIAAGAEGYDSQVGEHGLQLSGGQRQRVSVARALVKDAPIVLLDEPTASLDSEAERHVQDAIARLCQGRTTLVIAHRLHTITHADRILVVEDGQIVESGRHEELLARGGRYADVFRMQFRKELEPGAAQQDTMESVAEMRGPHPSTSSG